MFCVFFSEIQADSKYNQEIIKRVKDFLKLLATLGVADGQRERETDPEQANKHENELMGAASREFPQCITPECGQEIRANSLPIEAEAEAGTDSESKLQFCSLPELLNVQIRKPSLQSDRTIAMAIPSKEGPSHDCIPKVQVQSEVHTNLLNHKYSGDTYVKGTGARPKVPLKPGNERNEYKYPHASKNVSKFVSTSCQTDLSFSFHNTGYQNIHPNYLSDNNNDSGHTSEVADPTILPFQSYQSSNGSDLDIYTAGVKGQNYTGKVKGQSPQLLNESENQSDRHDRRKVNNLIDVESDSTTNEAPNKAKGRPILGKKYKSDAINVTDNCNSTNAIATPQTTSEPESSIRRRDDKAADMVDELHGVNKSEKIVVEEIIGKATEIGEIHDTTKLNHQVNKTSPMKRAKNHDIESTEKSTDNASAIASDVMKKTEHHQQILLSSDPAAEGNFSSLDGAVGGVDHHEIPKFKRTESEHQKTKDERRQVRRSSHEKNGISNQKEYHADQKIANKKNIDNAVTAEMKQNTNKIGEETNTDVHEANNEETCIQRGTRAMNNNNEAKHAKSSRSNNAEIEKLKSIRSENQRLKEAKTCRICRDRDANRMFLPCAHLAACSLCSPALTHCPQCRGKNKGVISVYFG